MAAGGSATCIRRASLDGGDATALLYKRCGVVEQFVGVGNVFDVEQLYERVAFGIEVLVHVFQNRLDANLLTVADAPHAVEGQALRDGTLENEHGRGTRAADEVHALGVERGNGLGEHGVVIAVEHADAVWTNQRAVVALAGVENLLFQHGSLVGLLAEASRDDDEGPYFFFLCQIFNVLRTELCRNDENGKVGGRQFLRIVEHLDALHLVLLWVDDA